MPTVTGVFYCTCSLSSSSLGKHYKCRKKQRWRRAAQITPTESLSTSRASIMAAVARGRGSGWWASSKKQNKNKLHNIYIPPSLVTYFTQKPWELIIRPCCQLSLIDFPSRFLLFFFSSPKWYKLYHSSIMQGRTTLGRPGFTMHILAEEGRRASVSVCEREIDSCVCLGFSFLPLWNIRDCFFLTDA